MTEETTTLTLTELELDVVRIALNTLTDAQLPSIDESDPDFQSVDKKIQAAIDEIEAKS